MDAHSLGSGGSLRLPGLVMQGKRLLISTATMLDSSRDVSLEDRLSID